MATTRELAEAYAYENRRRTTGLLRGADEAQQDPRRRLNRSFGGGLAFGVLAVAGFGIAGWLGGGSGPDLPGSGAVVVGDDGDRYAVADGTVHPALNLASALLIGGGEVTKVRQGTLNEAPRGLPVGIPGAPDALPGSGDLVDDPWTLCAVPSEAGGAPSETGLYVSVPGTAPGGDQPEGSTVLAEQEDGALWLLTEGRRYALTENLRDVLELRSTNPVQLPADIIATLPEGPALETPVPGSGAGQAPQAGLGDARVGDLAHTESGGAPQFYIVRPDGLVSVSELVYTLMLPGADQDHVLSAAEAARAPRSDESPPGDPAWPDSLPQAETPARNQPVCVSTPPGGEPGNAPWQATIHLPRTMPSPSGVTPVTAGSEGQRLGLLDGIYVPAGAGAVVRANTSAAAGGTYTLITDSGTAYPFSSPEAVERLRYDPTQAPSVPKAFVGLLPTGPVLDPDAAARQHSGGEGMEHTPPDDGAGEAADEAGDQT